MSTIAASISCEKEDSIIAPGNKLDFLIGEMYNWIGDHISNEIQRRTANEQLRMLKKNLINCL